VELIYRCAKDKIIVLFDAELFVEDYDHGFGVHGRHLLLIRSPFSILTQLRISSETAVGIPHSRYCISMEGLAIPSGFWL
jgi:hypothetical protein